MPGRKKHGSIPRSRWKVYEALKKKMGKTRAAKIAMAGITKAGRKRMAQKASRTRKRRGKR